MVCSRFHGHQPSELELGKSPSVYFLCICTTLVILMLILNVLTQCINLLFYSGYQLMHCTVLLSMRSRNCPFIESASEETRVDLVRLYIPACISSSHFDIFVCKLLKIGYKGTFLKYNKHVGISIQNIYVLF